ncbi:MAG: response regulator [Chloroflexota bacterium]
MTNLSVLVVEDDPSSSEILEQILEHNGMAITTAASAEDALNLLEQTTYDLAILDLALPGMDGWQLKEQMNAMPTAQDTITIALTAYYTPLLAKEAKDAGFVAAFPKPITDVFVKSLQRLL